MDTLRLHTCMASSVHTWLVTMHELELGNTDIPVAITEGQSWMEKHIEALPLYESNHQQRRLTANLMCAAD